jgi:hypothetical protein
VNLETYCDRSTFGDCASSSQWLTTRSEVQPTALPPDDRAMPVELDGHDEETSEQL